MHSVVATREHRVNARLWIVKRDAIASPNFRDCIALNTGTMSCTNHRFIVIAQRERDRGRARQDFQSFGVRSKSWRQGTMRWRRMLNGWEGTRRPLRRVRGK